MKIHHKLLFAISFFACLAGAVGFYSLHATQQIIRSFEGGDEHFRTIIAAATETASSTQRAQGHLLLYLILHDPTDLEKFHQRTESMRSEIALLEKTVAVPEGRQLLVDLRRNADQFVATGKELVQHYHEEKAAGVTFAAGDHPELMKRLSRRCLEVKEAAMELETLETDFLNKQLAITTASEVSTQAKMAEARLILYLTLREPGSLSAYKESCAALDRAIATLDRRVRNPGARALLSGIQRRHRQFDRLGSILLASCPDVPRAATPFNPAEHAKVIRRLNAEAAGMRGLGLELSSSLAELEYAKKAATLKTADSLQRSVLLLAIASGVFILVFGYFLSVAIAKPIITLRKAAQRLGNNEVHLIPKLGGRGEVASLAESFQRMADELRETRDELISSKEYTDNILRSMSDALFVVSPEGTLQTVNRAACQLLGYEEKEIIGKPLEDILSQSSLFLPDLLEKSPSLLGVELTLRGKHLTSIPVSFSCTIMYDRADDLEGIVCVAKDISEQKKRMEELARLATVVEQAAEAIVITDPRGRIQYVNPAFEKITGYSKNEAIGGSPRLLKSDKHDHRFYQDLRQTLVKGEIWSGHFINRKKDGTLYDEECIISPVRDQTGGVINYVALKRDVTHEKGLERQLIQSQKHEALGTLAGGIAHDLNNILTPVIGYASLAMNNVAPDSKTHQHLEMILQAGGRATNLVNQILTFCRKNMQKKEPLHLNTIVKEVLAFLGGTLPATIEIRQDLQKSDPLILADPNQMHQVIMNLCTNAYQAMLGKCGILKISLREERNPPQSAREHLAPGKFLRLAVSDTGCGMNTEMQARIFEPYFTTKEKGSGLGLATVHGIIKNHEGTISVHSRPGEGTTFEIFLPLLETPTASRRKAPEKSCPPRAPGEKWILFVDDEQAVVELGKEVLQNSGYRVVGQTNSQEALNLFESAPDRFDLVVTDHTMPGLTGMDLSRRLLALRQDLPIMLITGFSEAADEQRVHSIGIRALLMKPFKPDDLTRRIHELLCEDREIRN